VVEAAVDSSLTFYLSGT